MKKFLICLSCLICLLCVLFAGVTGSVSADTAAGRIVVCGTGEVRLAPDVAIVRLGVETHNESLDEAEEENSKTVAAVTSKLGELGLGEGKTKNLFVLPSYDFSKGVICYQVANSVEFKTNDFDNLESVISQLTEVGARLYGVTYTLEDYEKSYNEALGQALENAKVKAAALGGEDFTSYTVCEKHSSRSCCGGFNGGKPSAGEIVIKANVKVAFDYAA